MASFEQVISQLEEQRKEAQQQVDRLGSAIAALRGVNGNSRSVKRGGPRQVRALSAAARRKISLAQKARWARVRQQQKKAA